MEDEENEGCAEGGGNERGVHEAVHVGYEEEQKESEGRYREREIVTLEKGEGKRLCSRSTICAGCALRESGLRI